MAESERIDRFLPPGTKVRLDSLQDGETPVSEYGVVVHCWPNEGMAGLHDCIVAFFGSAPPLSGELSEWPYVLRYAAVSLSVLDEWPLATES
jgi:hypothetical protein